MKKLRVCVVTGTRAEFGIWRPVLRAIEASKVLELQLVVTGMHLLEQFGATVKEIEASGIPIAARVAMYRPNEPAAESLARGTAGLGAAFAALNSQLVMVLGDRLEMLAAASAALAERTPIAHVHGGETAPGIWDEQIRHAITKMAHIHFCATKTAGRRIMRMGEPKSRVHVVGAPALDVFSQEGLARRTRTPSRKASEIRPFLALHPSGGSDEIEYMRTNMILDALQKVFPGYRVWTVGPNNDPGHGGILRAYRNRRAEVKLEMNLLQVTFHFDLAGDGLLVGNSSAGIIEAASLGVAVVNIGSRQAGRERNTNVIDVGWNRAEIERGLRKVLTDKGFARRVARRKNVYGDGKASGRIVAVLEKLAREGISLEKRFVDG